MARARSILHTVARGKCGDVVFCSNQFADCVIKTYTPPAQPPSIYRDAVQTYLTTLRSHWLGYSESSRQSWNDFGLSVRSLSPLIDRPLPGFHSMVLCLMTWGYTRLIGVHGGAYSYTPPSTLGLLTPPHIKAVYYDAPNTRLRFTIENSNLEAVRYFAVATKPQSITRNRWQREYDPTSWSRSSTKNPFITGFAYINGILPGYAYFWKIRSVSNSGPRKSSRYIYGRTQT